MVGKLEGQMIILVLLLVLSGLIFVYSASFPLSVRLYGEPTAFLRRQLLGIAMGLVLLGAFHGIDYRTWAKLSVPFLSGTFLLVLLTQVPGIGVGGRWISLGPLTLQPSEFGKLSLLLYLGASIVNREERIADFKEGVLPHIVVLGAFGLTLLSQPDFGMFLLYSALTLFLLWTGGARIGHLAGVGALGLPLLGGLLVAAPYRVGRLLAFLSPGSYRDSYGYQVYQSMLAIGAGGVFGRGLGASRAKLFYLPSAHNDFIFAVVGEEVGLLGCLALVALLAALVFLGFKAAESAPDRLGTLYALGASFLLGFQSLLNLGVVVGVLPVTGLTLPFISYGGSSIAVSLGLVGLLIGIARRGER